MAPQATAPAKPTVNLGIPPPTREPEDAFSFIRSKGGVQPSQHLTDDANRVVLSSAWGNRPGGKLVDPKGMSLNHMREALAEEGWLTGAAGKDEHAAAEFINNVAAEHVAGRKVYRPEDEAIAEQYEQQRHAEAMRAHAQEGYRDQVLDVEDRAGMRLSDAEIDHAVNLMSDDPTLHPEEAVRQAAMAGEEVALQVNAQRNAFGRPGMPQAEQDALQLPAFGHNGGPPLEENYPPSTDKDLREINRRYADYKNTYRSGAVGEVLASGKGPGGFKLNDSAVPGKLFKPGPGGAEAADSLIKQAGGVREAAARLGDYPALLFRNEVMPNGVVDPARYARFQAKYAAALDKFPTIAAKFRTAAEAQRQVEAAAARGEAKIAQFQRNAASAYLTKAGDVVDPGRAITKLLNSDNVGQSFRNLMRDAAGNDAAVDGIRRNLLDEIVRRGSTTKEAGQSGVRALGKGNYQRVINDPKMAAAIKEVLPPASQRILRNVSEDMDLMDRAMNVAKVPGSPGTAADLRAMVEHGGPEGLTAFWLLMAGEKVAEVLGWVSGSGPVTRAILETTGAFGANMLRVKRAAALENVEKVATEMVLQPNTLGRVLMERLARERPDQFSRRIAHRVMQAVSGTAIAAQPSGARSP